MMSKTPHVRFNLCFVRYIYTDMMTTKGLYAERPYVFVKRVLNKPVFFLKTETLWMVMVTGALGRGAIGRNIKDGRGQILCPAKKLQAAWLEEGSA